MGFLLKIGAMPHRVIQSSTSKSSLWIALVGLGALGMVAGRFARYGVEGSAPTPITEFARVLTRTAKAFAKGLAQSVVQPGMHDDPYGAFAAKPRQATRRRGRIMKRVAGSTLIVVAGLLICRILAKNRQRRL
jgi:hypothetical protein